MCFSEKRNKKNTFKLCSEKNLKNKIFTDKDQIYLISNKEFISRNYKKLQKIKENTSKSKLQFLIEKEKNSSLKIKSPNKFDRKLLIQKNLLHFNSTKSNNIHTNKNFYSLSMYNETKKELYQKYINDEIYTYKDIEGNLKKFNNSKSLINKSYIDIIQNNKTIKKKHRIIDFNKVISKENDNRNKNKRKINEPLLSNDFLKIRMLNLNKTTNHKSANYSKNSFINSSNSKKINENQSKEIECKIKNEKKKRTNLLIMNKLKKIFNNCPINKRLNKTNSKYKKRKSLYFFNDIFDKIKEKNLIFLKLQKIKKSKDFSFVGNRKKNKTNKDVNNLMTSGSISEDDQKFEEKKLEFNPEEIHFLAIKYIHEIKKDIFK